MRLLLANPNATDSVTRACADLARAAAAPGTDVVAWTNHGGPPAVDSFYGDYLAGRPLALALAAVTPAPDALVLAGFGNYGTSAVKEISDVPVVGLAEAAMAYATPLCHRFAIVTTSSRMIAYTEDLVQALGFAARCAAVRAVELPPIGAGRAPEETIVAALAAEAEAAATGADLVILGGARLSPYAGALRSRTPLVVVEPVACAVTMAESLVRIGLRQSKAGKFAPPPRPLADYGG
jgi:Asp/Glu/hydantoin racemase